MQPGCGGFGPPNMFIHHEQKVGDRPKTVRRGRDMTASIILGAVNIRGLSPRHPERRFLFLFTPSCVLSGSTCGVLGKRRRMPARADRDQVEKFFLVLEKRRTFGGRLSNPSVRLAVQTHERRRGIFVATLFSGTRRSRLGSILYNKNAAASTSGSGGTSCK